MRLTYIFAVVIAVTLHASGNALSTTKESNHATISNVAATNIAHSLDANKEDGGRLLRRVDDGEEVEDENRSFKNFGKSLKNFIAKRTPFTEAWYKRRFIQKAREEAVRRQTVKDNIKYASS
ncbi:hypothetical protein PRIC1_004897 [Phytophthora ramorum]|uniref:RxLR effector protein Avh23 n=1 Tax=Phytophthora ramorum TaxID=164328 RepID=UPI00309D1EB2|nr:RxLR effector protein Avh23 [Phytophthora ramorum]KAH7507016.1 RxLR effector protein Avh23 [Phytophthora ramorum]